MKEKINEVRLMIKLMMGKTISVNVVNTGKIKQEKKKNFIFDNGYYVN